jgi:hypothetical protein
LNDLSLFYVFGFVFCLRGFNFREKLEGKYENSKKGFESLNKWCKTKKNQGVQSAKNIEVFMEILPPHIHITALGIYADTLIY